MTLTSRAGYSRAANARNKSDSASERHFALGIFYVGISRRRGKCRVPRSRLRASNSFLLIRALWQEERSAGREERHIPRAMARWQEAAAPISEGRGKLSYCGRQGLLGIRISRSLFFGSGKYAVGTWRGNIRSRLGRVQPESIYTGAAQSFVLAPLLGALFRREIRLGTIRSSHTRKFPFQLELRTTVSEAEGYLWVPIRIRAAGEYIKSRDRDACF